MKPYGVILPRSWKSQQVMYQIGVIAGTSKFWLLKIALKEIIFLKKETAMSFHI